MNQLVFKTYVPPTAIKYAELISRQGRGSAVRCLLLVDGSGFSIARQRLGVGQRFTDELVVTERTTIKHEADSLFQAELVSLEQEGFDILSEKERDIVKFDSKSVTLSDGFKALNWGDMNYEQRRSCVGVSALTVYSGIHVCVIIDEKLKSTVYPMQHNGPHREALKLSVVASTFLDKVKLNNEPGPCVLEAFYSDSFGLTITDGSIINGVDMSDATFAQRHDALMSLFGGSKEHLFSSGVAKRVPFSMSMLASEERNIEHACAYVLKAQESCPTIIHGGFKGASFPSVIMANSQSNLTSYVVSTAGSIECQITGKNKTEVSLAPFTPPAGYLGMSRGLFIRKAREPILFA